MNNDVLIFNKGSLQIHFFSKLCITYFGIYLHWQQLKLCDTG